MDCERGWDAAEGLIDDAKKRLGAEDTAKRPEQGTGKPSGDKDGKLSPEENLENVEEHRAEGLHIVKTGALNRKRPPRPSRPPSVQLVPDVLMRMRARCLDDEPSKLYLGHMFDDRVQADERVARFRDLLDASHSLEEVVAALAQSARLIVGSDGIAVILRDQGCCHYVAEDAIEPLWTGQRFPLENCVSGWAMLNAETVVVPDVSVDPRVPVAPYQSKAICSLVMVPIGSPEPIAAIGAYWSSLVFLGDATIACVERLARDATNAIGRLSMLEMPEARTG